MKGAVTAAACLALTAALPGASVLAQQDVLPGRSAEVREGTCADLGAVVALLETAPARAPMGQRPGAATSVTDVMLPLAELTAEPHVVVVQPLVDDSEGDALCGPVGGAPVDDQGLAFALATADGETAGIAWLRELGLDATTVHVFVIADGLEPAGPPEDGEGAGSGEEIDPREDIDVDVGD